MHVQSEFQKLMKMNFEELKSIIDQVSIGVKYFNSGRFYLMNDNHLLKCVIICSATFHNNISQFLSSFVDDFAIFVMLLLT